MSQKKNDEVKLLMDGSTSIQEDPFDIVQSNEQHGAEDINQIFTSSFDRQNEAQISWHNISVSAKTPKQRWWRKKTDSEEEGKKFILHNVSGKVEPGELLAIMGASGAGKTTLMNVLTNRNLRTFDVVGDVKVNGIKDEDALSRVSSYVQQDDLFIGTLTVKEHLIFQAILRMDQHLSYEQKMAKVASTIAELGLLKCIDTMIGVIGGKKGISGGERKRLAFASEILTNPAVLYCDEPTSGLDSYMSMNVVSVLRRLAYGGRTIIITIHQPSSEVYEMFDNILLMADGRVAFMGHREDAVRHFEKLGYHVPKNYNPADYFIYNLAIIPAQREECYMRVNQICEAFEKSKCLKAISNGNEVVDRVNFAGDTKKKLSRYKASWFTQLRVLSWRSFLTVWREPDLYKIRLFQVVVNAIILGLIYLQQTYDQRGIMNINGVMFLMMTSISFPSMFAVINVFCAELPIFLREHWNGMYRTDIYFFCKTLSEMPFFLFLPIVFGTILYWMAGLKSDLTAFLFCLLALILVANASASLGYVISCASSSVSMALSLGSPVTTPLLLFGGYFLNSGTIPFYFDWLKYLSWYFYGFEILAVNQWTGVNITCDLPNSCVYTGDEVINQLHFHKDFFLRDFFLLLALLLGYRFLAFLFLLKKSFNKM